MYPILPELEQATMNNEHGICIRYYQNSNDEQATMNNEHGICIRYYQNSNNEQATMNNEHGICIRYYQNSNDEQATINNEHGICIRYYQNSNKQLWTMNMEYVSDTTRTQTTNKQLWTMNMEYVLPRRQGSWGQIWSRYLRFWEALRMFRVPTDFKKKIPWLFHDFPMTTFANFWEKQKSNEHGKSLINEYKAKCITIFQWLYWGAYKLTTLHCLWKFVDISVSTR